MEVSLVEDSPDSEAPLDEDPPGSLDPLVLLPVLDPSIPVLLEASATVVSLEQATRSSADTQARRIDTWTPGSAR